MLGNARLFCQTGSVVYPPSPALGGRVAIGVASKRGSVNVRFAPKAALPRSAAMHNSGRICALLHAGGFHWPSRMA